MKRRPMRCLVECNRGVSLGCEIEAFAGPQQRQCSIDGSRRVQSHETEWVLLTSGTTGAPKLVLHTLFSLVSAFFDRSREVGGVVWSTFYDLRRYGGLQIFLRALFTGSMVMSAREESVFEFLGRAGRYGVTHISGTASHWRRVLMSGASSPQWRRTTYGSQVRLPTRAFLTDSLPPILAQKSYTHLPLQRQASHSKSRIAIVGFPVKFHRSTNSEC